MARSNIRVNGQNLEDLNEDEGGCPSCAFIPPFLSVLTSRSRLVPPDTEPFDEGFDRHIWSLADQSLRWDLQIARERRTKPEEVEKQMRELLASQRELDAEEAAALDTTLPVPLMVRNAPTRLMSDLGYSKGYRYNPDYQ